MTPDDPRAATLFVHWERFVGWLFLATRRFPRDLRPSLGLAINNLALGIHGALCDARFGRDRVERLHEIRVDIDKLRLLLRLSHTLAALDHRSYELSCADLDRAGSMVGGWLRTLTTPAGARLAGGRPE